MTASFRFDRFCLDPGNRRLTNQGQPVELNARYLDALTLLVREAGRLIPKDRFMDEVWRGIPVTDEALTQCIKTLRSRLGDDAAAPRFIETVPKHGYRFIAPVDSGSAGPAAAPARNWPQVLRLGVAGTLGGGLAGILGGLFYGFVAASEHPDTGALSVMLVMICLTLLIALVGGAGVAFGVAATGFARGRPPQWSIAGGAVGGLVVGAIVKLIGLDAFNLLIGQSPGDITGPFEGALIGGAVGFGAWLASRGNLSLRRSAFYAGLAGAVAGILIALMGGHLMAGSLDLLARRFPGSRLRLDQIGRLFGEGDFGPVSQAVTAGLEGLLFAACVVAAMILAQRGERQD